MADACIEILKWYFIDLTNFEIIRNACILQSKPTHHNTSILDELLPPMEIKIKHQINLVVLTSQLNKTSLIHVPPYTELKNVALIHGQ